MITPKLIKDRNVCLQLFSRGRASAGGSTHTRGGTVPLGDATDSIMACIETCQAMKTGSEFRNVLVQIFRTKKKITILVSVRELRYRISVETFQIPSPNNNNVPTV